MEKIVIYKASIGEKSYIGISTQYQERKKQHIRAAINKSNKLFHQAIKTFGDNNILWEVLEEVDDFELSKKLEKRYIKEYKTYFKFGGYNMTMGGQGTIGFSHPKNKEWRENHSKKLKGRKMGSYSIERKKNISNSVKQFFKKNPDKKPIGEKNGMYGEKHSKEWRENHSKFMKSRPLPKLFRENGIKASIKKWVIINPSGERFIIENLANFCRKNNLNSQNMASIARKIQKRNHKGYMCEKYEEKN